MRFLISLVLIIFLVASCVSCYVGEASDDEQGSSGGNEALTGALMGGLLGAGLGAAIGSASGKAGTGALIGGGVGAVGGTLLGANQAAKKSAETTTYQEERNTPKEKIKKRVVREYDENGNVISEKEVKE